MLPRVTRLPCIAGAALLFLTAPGAGAAQQPVGSDLQTADAWTSPGSVPAGLALQSSGQAAGVLDLPPAAVSPSPPPDRTSQILLGAGIGVLAGSLVGGVYGHLQYDPCVEDCLLSRPMESVLFAMVGGSAGGLLGAFVGGLWPERRYESARVSIAPSTSNGIVVSLGLRH